MNEEDSAQKLNNVNKQLNISLDTYFENPTSRNIYTEVKIENTTVLEVYKNLF